MKHLSLLLLGLCLLAPICLQGQESSNVETSTASGSLKFQELLDSAQKGDSQAQFEVSRAYYEGRVVQQNLPEAFKWASKAADQRNAKAEFIVGWCYENGTGVPHDDVQALRWQERAAEDGDADAQVAMAERFRVGKGEPADMVQAVKWYKAAAIQNNARGEAAYGYALITGDGTSKDLKSGLGYLLAASGTNAYARLLLAECYSHGTFVKEDPVEAYKWCLLALEMNQEATGLATKLKSRLTPLQIIQATKEVAYFHSSMKEGDLQTSDLSILFSDQSQVVIPFDEVGGNILIPITLADRQTYYFMVDTGSPTIISSEIADRLKIGGDQYLPIQGNADSLMSLARIGHALEFSLSGMKISGVTAFLYSDFSLDQYLGHPLAGILGYDVLRHLIFSIDYVKKIITFQKPGTFKSGSGINSLPIFTKNSRPFVQAEIGFEDGSKAGWFLVDTGGGNTVSVSKIFQEANPEIKLEQPVKTAFLGFGGISFTLNGKCPSVTLGTVSVRNPIVTFLTTKDGGLQNLNGGTLDSGILRRFNETFDGPGARLYLEPNSRIKDPFTYNNVGLGIKTAKGDYHTFRVFAIVPGSPAAIAKFQVQDQIVSLDNTETAAMSLDDLYEIIRKEGAHHLEIIRTGMPEEIELRILPTIR